MSADLHSRVEDLHRKIEGLHLREPTRTGHLPEDLIGLLSDLQLLLEEVMVTQDELLSRDEDRVRSRETIESQRHYYREIFDQAPECYLLTDAFGKITDANQAASQLFNAPLGYIIGMPLCVYMYGKSRQSFGSCLGRLGRGDGVQKWVGFVSPRKSQPVPVAISAGPICGSDGKLEGLRWILHEISDQWHDPGSDQADDLSPALESAEHRARAAERRASCLDSAISSIAEGVLILGPSGEVLNINPAAMQMIGCSEDDLNLLHSDMFGLLNAESLDGRKLDVRDSIVARSLNGEMISGEACVIHNIADGRAIKVSASASPIRGGDGDVIGAVATLVDITQALDLQERLEAEKRRSDELAWQAGRRADELDAIFDAINEPVIIYDLLGTPVRSNFAAIFAFGVDPSRSGKDSPKPSLFYPDGRVVPYEDQPSTRALKGDVVKGERFTFIDQDGRKMAIMATATPITSCSTISGAVAVWHDITEVDQLTRQLDLERERLVAVLRQMPSGVMIAEAPSGKLIMGNNKVRHIWRHPFLPAEEISGYSAYRGFHLDGKPYQPDEWPLARSVTKGEVVIGEEIDILRGDGTHGTISMSSSPIFDRNADVYGAVVTFNDITESKRILNAFRESEAQYKLLFESANDGVLLHDLVTSDSPGIFVAANQAIRRMLGYTPEEMSLLSPLDIQDHEGLKSIPDETERMVSGQKLSIEKVLVGKGGRRIIAEVNSSVFELNGKKMVLSVIRDITERKKIDEELRLSRDRLEQMVRERTSELEAAVKQLTESEERYKCLVELSPEPVMVIVKGELAYANPAAAALFGASRPEEIMGRQALDFISPGHREFARSLAERIKQDGSAGPEELKMSMASGAAVDVEITGVRVIYQGRAAILMLAKDLTMRKRALVAVQRARQAAEAAARVKSEFLAGVSHEIRTPMNAVMGMTSLLLCTDLDADQRSYAETIRSSSDAMLSIINEILDFSKIEEGSLELEMQPFDLQACIEDSLDLAADAAAEKGLDMAYDISGPECLVGDVTHLRQVLSYLLSNAVKFTNRGEVLVSVSDLELDCGQHELHFAVKDTGIGISKSSLCRLFRPFGQMDSSLSSGYGGLGLGLAISKGIIEAMGGTIWAESILGKGSTFHFTILAKSSQKRPDSQRTLPGIDGKSALVVSGSEIIRNLLIRQMGAWGISAKAVASASEALDLLGAERFDAALLDMVLPDMDVSSLASEMRMRDSGIYLVAVSHRRPESEWIFDSFLTKPIRSSRLKEALQGLPAPGCRRIGDVCGTAQACHMRILVAEDNLVNQKVALLMLGRLGYAADAVANGLEVLEALERQHYDIVLMDLKMPHMNGFEATRQILQIWPDSRPKIVAMTAYALKGDRDRCLNAGMDDYISKPITMEELKSALDRCRPSSK
ncbi:MAG TPA: PAS domain S-box protein [Methanotrichaceae archaeon]|nr:PAS domain S-box protein [Methanotrichaceae archaeon]